VSLPAAVTCAHIEGCQPRSVTNKQARRRHQCVPAGSAGPIGRAAGGPSTLGDRAIPPNGRLCPRVALQRRDGSALSQNKSCRPWPRRCLTDIMATTPSLVAHPRAG
jgi:hypothetical protein